MKYSVKEITTIAITAALTVVLGLVFYAMGSLLPIPGSKFLIFAPFLGFMLYIPINKVKRVGVVSAVSAVFAGIMGFINVFMAAAILLAGLTSDILTLLIFRNYNSELKKIASAGFYSVASFVWAFIMAYHFTGNRAFLLIGDRKTLFTIAIVIYGLGLMGAAISKKLIKNRIENAISNRE